MSLEYIRNYYSVPAKRGGRIRFTGFDAPREGKIVGARQQYLRVRFDGWKRPQTLHPTWEVTYL